MSNNVAELPPRCTESDWKAPTIRISPSLSMSDAATARSRLGAPVKLGSSPPVGIRGRICAAPAGLVA